MPNLDDTLEAIISKVWARSTNTHLRHNLYLDTTRELYFLRSRGPFNAPHFPRTRVDDIFPTIPSTTGACGN